MGPSRYLENESFSITDPYKGFRPPHEAPVGKIWKTVGNGEWILVDEYNHEGFKRKTRRKATNYTPPKKKRRK